MRRIAPLIVSMVLVAMGLAACSSSDEDVSAFCEDRDQLQASVEELRQYDIIGQGVDGLTEQVDIIGDELSALSDSAAEEFQDEVDAIRTSLDDLQTALTSASSPTEVASALSSGLPSVASAFQAFVDAAGAVDCE